MLPGVGGGVPAGTRTGVPYWYGVPVTVGISPKFSIGGGEETCHSSVCAFHGFATARSPRRQERIML
jgi:hypothetical protein